MAKIALNLVKTFKVYLYTFTQMHPTKKQVWLLYQQELPDT